MDIQITISAEDAALIASKAAATGVTIEAYAAGIVSRSLMAGRALEEISGTTGQAFAKSGMSEHELSAILEAEKHAMRAWKRAS